MVVNSVTKGLDIEHQQSKLQEVLLMISQNVRDSVSNSGVTSIVNILRSRCRTLSVIVKRSLQEYYK